MRERFQNPEGWQKNIDPDGENLDLKELRLDVSDLLGKELTMQEKRCYSIIHNNGTSPTSQEDLYFELTGIQADNRRSAVKFNGLLISRIREKLGNKSILTITNKGYMSRRGWIEKTDFKNLPQRKLSEIEKELTGSKWGQKRQISETALSPSEKEILKLIQKGLVKNNEIALLLEIKPGTVSKKMSRIYKKLEVPPKKDLALSKAIQVGEMPPFQPSIDIE